MNTNATKNKVMLHGSYTSATLMTMAAGLAVGALRPETAQRMQRYSSEPARQRRPPPRNDGWSAESFARQEHNRAVDARKAEKRARQAARRAQP